MRPLPSQAEFERWRSAFPDGEVKPELVGFVNSIAAAAVSTSTFAGLCPDREWTPEALSDAISEFWCERLLPRTLERAFEATSNPSSFGRYLERAFRNMLIDAKRAAGEPRLRTRIHETLCDGSFQRVAGHSDRGEELWALGTGGGSEQGRHQGGETELLSHLHALGLEETVQTSDGRADVVISNKELSRLLVQLFERVEAPLSLNELSTAFRQRFVAHYLPPIVSDEETLGEIKDGDATDVAEVVSARQLASRALAELSPQQVVVLLERFHNGRTLEEIASANGCSRGTAANELQRATEVIRQFATPEDIELIWRAMLDLSLEGVEMLANR
jgi:RNA polymerase sigma factor (sigma-70 family)